MCDWSHACASVLTISKWARLCFPGPFLHNCRGEFASKEGEYIRNIYISMLMRLCHSAFTCALGRVRVVPLWISIPVASVVTLRCVLQLLVFVDLSNWCSLYSPIERNKVEICVRGEVERGGPVSATHLGLLLGTFPHVCMCIYTACKCMKYWITSTVEDQCMVMCINMHFVLPDVWSWWGSSVMETRLSVW